MALMIETIKYLVTHVLTMKYLVTPCFNNDIFSNTCFNRSQLLRIKDTNI